MNETILNKLRPITPEEKSILDGNTEINKDLYTENGGSIINSKKLLDSGKLISIRPHTRFIRFPEHSHDYVEAIYMCSGETIHIINGNKIKLCSGELLFLGQTAMQEILPANENDIAVNFIILPQFFDKTLEMLGEEETPLRKFIADCLGKTTDTEGYLHFKVADVLPVQNLIENLLWTIINNTPNKRNINQTTMGLLFMQLLNYTDRLSYPQKKESFPFRVFSYIESNYKDGSLSELAEIMHYDLFWLSKEIKSATGFSYTVLIQEKRLSQSAFLLRTTKMKITDIANAVGYTNISYFHRLFNSKYGVSPKKYRDSK
ncbi:MAG: AraC family transcriptional regulator [Oscillospiraceae bacterium]|nr:AraC family transcriptional regulator [Oscillospiraceae bacterium]MDD4413282.1 AraC family transcriptional regulator [Oscillospiraceae bacterium]